MNIGEQIKELRKSANMSAAKLGELIDLSQQQVSSIENGVSNITVDKLEKICNVFNISPKYFWNDLEQDFPKEYQELLYNIRKFTPEQIKKLNEFLKVLK